MKKSHSLQTHLLHVGSIPCDQSNPVPVGMPPIRTSTVRFSSMEELEKSGEQRMAGDRVITYGRMGMDTHVALENAICSLENGKRCFLAPSGLMAMSLVMLSLLNAGEHFIASDGVYGPLRDLGNKVLKRFNIEGSYCNVSDLEALEKELRPNTKVLYIESPSSSLLEMLDVPALSAFAKKHGLILVMDNTWGAGYLYQALDLGVDVSVIACTKYIGGHSDLLMGAVVAKDPELILRLDQGQYTLGYATSADDAWLALRGIRSLGVRIKAHEQQALKVCEALDKRPEVLQIYHPAWHKDPGHELWQRDCTGSNGLMSIKLDLTPAQAKVFVNSLHFFGIGFSWGGYESLAIYVPQSSLDLHSYWRNSVHNDKPVVRLHIGLEDTNDLLTDIYQALDKAKAS